MSRNKIFSNDLEKVKLISVFINGKMLFNLPAKFGAVAVATSRP